MPQFCWFLITMAVALAGGFLFMKLKVPAGALIGALLFTGVLSVMTGRMFMYKGLKVLTKTVAGLFIGMSVTSDSVKKLKTLFKPTFILVVIIISFCLCMGIAMYYGSGLDVVTSLFSVAPGGMQDMTLMTIDMGGDAAVVAVMQVLRLLTVYFVSMPMAKLLSKRISGSDAQDPAGQADKAGAKGLAPETKRKRIAFSSLVALIGGSLGYLLSKLADFSTLVLIVSMIVAAAVNMATGKLYMPKMVRRITQMMSGALIGVTVTYESLEHLKMAMLPAIFIIIGFVAINVLISVIISRTCDIDIATAMLSSSAGGASESALVAADFGADPAVVTVLQVTRLFCTTAFYPILVKLIYPML
ncbi:MAG: AbrB family transcriptional regulator [Firmicutes bacterium]|nr:AbrB family transcriptional regulator [Bacillota bacterium]